MIAGDKKKNAEAKQKGSKLDGLRKAKKKKKVLGPQRFFPKRKNDLNKTNKRNTYLE